MTSTTKLRQTALYEEHKALGARLVDFHGWELPIQYEGILKEHEAVRTRCGIFDVSHMGRLQVSGADALALLQKTNTNDIARLAPGAAVYSHLPNERGGIIDDVIVGCLGPARYLVVVNAATRDGDISWLKKQANFGDTSFNSGVELADISDKTSMIALQGPKAEALAGSIFKKAAALPRFGICEDSLWGETVTISRTGYTGEDGFEFIISNANAAKLWRHLLSEGRSLGISPCGLGARDTLRLEAGLLLGGQDFDENCTSLEAGYAWVVKFSKNDFIGKKALELQKKEGLKRRMAGVVLDESGVPRPGAAVFWKDARVGTLSSATFSPTLQKGIGMGYFDKIDLAAGEPVAVDVRGRHLKARVAGLPFYRRAQDGKKNAKA